MQFNNYTTCLRLFKCVYYNILDFTPPKIVTIHCMWLDVLVVDIQTNGVYNKAYIMALIDIL